MFQTDTHIKLQQNRNLFNKFQLLRDGNLQDRQVKQT